MNTKHLLSKEFVEFSSKITALHERREELVAEFQERHKAFKTAMAEIDQEAGDLQDNFDNWVAAQGEEKKNAS